MNKPNENPTWRKPAGMFAILALIVIWTGLVVSASDYIGDLNIVLQSIIYLVAGIVWIAPLRPLMIWMETGSFIAPNDRQTP